MYAKGRRRERGSATQSVVFFSASKETGVETEEATIQLYK
jgi:hypothetical protein